MSHLTDINQGYWKHWARAHGYAAQLAAAAILAVVHAWIPYLFPNTVSRLVDNINETLRC